MNRTLNVNNLSFQIIFILIVAFAFTSQGLVAEELFPVGTANKVKMVPYHCGNMNSFCVFYNPAQVYLESEAESATEVALELGYINGVQSYEHPDFDPVRVDVRTPIAGFGITRHIPEMNFDIAVAALPTSLGEQNISGLPRRIAGIYESLEVKNESVGYDIAAGFATRFARGINAGISTIFRYEHRELNATLVGDDVSLMRLKVRNQFYIPVFGLSWSYLNQLNLSASYRLSRRKTYHGDQKSATSEEETAPKLVNFDPAIFGFGASYKYKQWEGSLSAAYKNYGVGRAIVRDGLTSDNQKADLDSIWEYGVELGYQFLPDFIGALGLYDLPSPWGDGQYDSVTGESVFGADFGQVNATPRRGFTLGAQYRSQEFPLRINVALFHFFGSREVENSGDHPGYYQMECNGITSEITYML